jgi:thioredoxin 1
MAEKKKFIELINQSDMPVLVDFYAVWCAPCKMVTPILHDVAQDFEDRIKVIKIDVDRNQQIAIKYGISSVPTLALFFNGSIMWRQSGVAAKSVIINQINKVLAKV